MQVVSSDWTDDIYTVWVANTRVSPVRLVGYTLPNLALRLGGAYYTEVTTGGPCCLVELS